MEDKLGLVMSLAAWVELWSQGDSTTGLDRQKKVREREDAQGDKSPRKRAISRPQNLLSLQKNKARRKI